TSLESCAQLLAVATRSISPTSINTANPPPWGQRHCASTVDKLTPWWERIRCAFPCTESPRSRWTKLGRMNGPLIVQSDKTVLLEVDHEQAHEARAALAPFAELERAPEHIHTYRITPLALWNATAAGHDAEQAVHVLESYSLFPVPQALLVDVAETMSRYGRVHISKSPAHGLILESAEKAIIEELVRHKKIGGMLGSRIDDLTISVPPSERGR